METAVFYNAEEVFPVKERQDKFYGEVIQGLKGLKKSLPSKYFYDEEGDRLFQQIMDAPEYYLTRCEMDIFTSRVKDLASAIRCDNDPFDIIELGAGDGSKTIHLLQYLSSQKADFNYLPIDISGNILNELKQKLYKNLPQLNVQALEGEYLDMLKEATMLSARRKVVLFLGGNIGNFTPEEAATFYSEIRRCLNPGDIVMTGFDLMKNPIIIMDAYSDKQGLTKAFNLNLLQRINNRLGANFDLQKFDHYCHYNPETGACKSYLVSLVKQAVKLQSTTINFEEGETIWMEISQKYSHENIAALARSCGFQLVTNLHDSKRWFTESIWCVKGKQSYQ